MSRPPDVGEYGLAALPVAGVPAVLTGRIVLVTAEVVSDPAFHGNPQQPPGQLLLGIAPCGDSPPSPLNRRLSA